jgi:hypothetical protein
MEAQKRGGVVFRISLVELFDYGDVAIFLKDFERISLGDPGGERRAPRGRNGVTGRLNEGEVMESEGGAPKKER